MNAYIQMKDVRYVFFLKTFINVTPQDMQRLAEQNVTHSWKHVSTL